LLPKKVYGIIVQNNPVNYTDPYGLVNWGQVGIGTLQALDALTIAGVGIVATAGTFLGSGGNPVLTGVVGVAMLPVMGAAVLEGYHAYHNIYEGIRDNRDVPKKQTQCK